MPTAKPTSTHEERVRARAHEIWERAGRPDGHHLAHWQQAEAEIAAEQPANAPRKRAAIPANRNRRKAEAAE